MRDRIDGGDPQQVANQRAAGRAARRTDDHALPCPRANVGNDVKVILIAFGRDQLKLPLQSVCVDIVAEVNPHDARPGCAHVVQRVRALWVREGRSLHFGSAVVGCKGCVYQRLVELKVAKTKVRNRLTPLVWRKDVLGVGLGLCVAANQHLVKAPVLFADIAVVRRRAKRPSVGKGLPDDPSGRRRPKHDHDPTRWPAFPAQLGAVACHLIHPFRLQCLLKRQQRLVAELRCCQLNKAVDRGEAVLCGEGPIVGCWLLGIDRRCDRQLNPKHRLQPSLVSQLLPAVKTKG